MTPPAPPHAPVFTSPEPAFDDEPRNLLADLFKVFLEVEQGEREASSVNIPDEIGRLRRRNRIE